MVTLLLRLLRLLPLLCGAHRHVALENLALRHQLAVYKKTVTRPKVRRSDRLFWVALSRVWAGWRQALVIVSPNTVLRWQRRRFCEHWTKLSARPNAGRPPVNVEIKALVTRMAAANPLWGAPRIHGELLRLGIDVSERTVSRLMPKRRPLPSQTWRTFLDNHVRGLVSLDFFTVPTARLRVLFVLVVLAHHRRRVIHFNVTEHPTAHWTTQQIVDAFPDDSAPAYLLRDRDQVYGEQFRHRVKGSPHGSAQPVAESLRGAAHRLDPTRRSGSRSGSRRKPPAAHSGPLLLLLSPGSHASLARQGCAGRPARRAPRGGRDRGDSRSRWPASPVRPPRGVVEHRRSPLPSNTRHRSQPSRPACPLSVLHRDSDVTV